MANYTGKGYFQSGNKLSPGRKPRATERAYLDATIASVTLGKWRKIVKRAVGDALAGDAKARAWLGKVLLGESPAEVVQLVEQLRAELWRLRGEEARLAAGSDGSAGAGPNGQAGAAGR